MTDELKQWEHDKGYTKGQIDILKKIKAEITEIGCFRNNPYNDKTEYSVSMKELRELFDKHISELKGE